MSFASPVGDAARTQRYRERIFVVRFFRYSCVSPKNLQLGLMV